MKASSSIIAILSLSSTVALVARSKILSLLAKFESKARLRHFSYSISFTWSSSEGEEAHPVRVREAIRASEAIGKNFIPRAYAHPIRPKLTKHRNKYARRVLPPFLLFPLFRSGEWVETLLENNEREPL